MSGLGMNILHMLGANDTGGIFLCKDSSLVACQF